VGIYFMMTSPNKAVKIRPSSSHIYIHILKTTFIDVDVQFSSKVLRSQFLVLPVLYKRCLYTWIIRKSSNGS